MTTFRWCCFLVLLAITIPATVSLPFSGLVLVAIIVQLWGGWIAVGNIRAQTARFRRTQIPWSYTAGAVYAHDYITAPPRFN